MKKWIKRELKNGNLNDLAEVSVGDIYTSLQDGDITIEQATRILVDAIKLAEAEVNYLGCKPVTNDNRVLSTLIHLCQRRTRLKSLIEYASQLNINVTTTRSENENGQESNDSVTPLGRIMWKGKKSDFARVYSILGRLIDCSKSEWERHFIDKNGEDMYKATDDHKGGTTRTVEIMTLQNVCKKMEPDQDDGFGTNSELGRTF